MTELEISILRGLCSVLTQDTSIIFSSLEKLVQFCISSVPLKDRQILVRAIKRCDGMTAEDQMQLWNELCTEVYFRSSEAAKEFTDELSRQLT